MNLGTSRRPLSRYQKINILYIFFVLGVAVLNVVYFMTFLHYPFPRALTSPTPVSEFITAIIFFVLILLPESRVGQGIQVAILLAFGYAAIVTAVDVDSDGMVNVALAVFLMVKYDFLTRARRLKLALIAAAALASVIVWTIDPRHSLAKGGLFIFVGCAAVLMLWFIFEEDVIRFQRERDELSRRRDADHPFVEFGKNTAGLSLDLKSDVNLINSMGSSLRRSLASGDRVKSEDVERLLSYVSRIERRVDLVRYVLVDRPGSSDELLDLNQLIEAVVYIFQIRPDYGKRIRFRFTRTEQPTHLGHRPGILTAIESTIEAVCARLRENSRQGEMPTVTIMIERDHDRPVVRIHDDGPEVPVCAGCEDDCMPCLENLAGTGTAPWVEPIRRAAQSVGESGGSLQVQTGSGLEVSICL